MIITKTDRQKVQKKSQISCKKRARTLKSVITQQACGGKTEMNKIGREECTQERTLQKSK